MEDRAMMPPRPPRRPDIEQGSEVPARPSLGTAMPMPRGIEPKPPSIRRETGIPSSEMDRTRPETLDQLRRRSGGR
jgi:hypothetical protein